jgi:hypothetical protein
VATQIVSSVEAQVGNQHVQVLIDSGSVRSLISFQDFRKLTGAQGFSKLSAVEVRCMSASGDNLDIMGAALVKLKIHGFSWNWKFLVSRKLCG